MLYDQQKARRQYQNAVNNAQGQAFEGYIKAGCEYYRQRERATVDKTPEPFRVTSKQRDGVFTGRFTALAQPDFQGTLAGGRSICFEAKYTTTDRLKRGILTDTQMAMLDLHAKLGAVAGVCAGIGDKFYFVPWDAWRDMKERYGRQYVTAADLEPYRVRFTGAVLFLDYARGGWQRVKQLTLGSLFDGIGGFPLAAQRCGIKTIWASEIEPTCIEITKRHFPKIEHLGDITKLHGGKIPPVDIISFGSPCQDLSSAGAQAGIDGARSGLFRDAVRIIYEMREATNGRYPTFIIWENVNGAFGSNDGNDFRTVLEEITNARIPMPTSGRWATAGMVRGCRGGASVAWRQLDSQFWGVPQRRKRIFLVGDFRAERAPQILFECESLLGYVRKSGKEREKVAAVIVGSIETSGGFDEGQCVVDFGRTDDRVYINADTARAITATDGGGGSATELYLLREGEPITHPINLQVATRYNKLGERTGMSVAEQGEPAYTLQAAHSHAVFAVYPIKNTAVYDESQISSPINASNPKINAPCHTLGATTAGRAVVFATYPINDGSIHGNANGLGFGEEGREAPTLTASDRHAIAACFAPSGHSGFTKGVGTLRASAGKHGRSSANILVEMYENHSHGGFREGCGALRASGGDYGGGSENLFIIFQKLAFYVRYVLRKLTPLECERLQGFPDYWTRYTATGAKIADTPRYTSLGNSLTVPCAERVFRGIVAVTGGMPDNV